MKVRRWIAIVMLLLFSWAVTWGTPQSVGAERQPNMRAALDHLQRAEAFLLKASSDKGGYRVKALKLTRDAIVATKEGIRFDNRN